MRLWPVHRGTVTTSSSVGRRRRTCPGAGPWPLGGRRRGVARGRRTNLCQSGLPPPKTPRTIPGHRSWITFLCKPLLQLGTRLSRNPGWCVRASSRSLARHVTSPPLPLCAAYSIASVAIALPRRPRLPITSGSFMAAAEHRLVNCLPSFARCGGALPKEAHGRLTSRSSPPRSARRRSSRGRRARAARRSPRRAPSAR